MKQSVAVMDFGTGKITVLVGSRGANGSIVINGIGRSKYAGYSAGRWLEPDRLTLSVSRAVSLAEERARIHIEKLYVGVPNDFAKCDIAELSVALNKKRRVTQADVDILHESGNKFNDLDWTVVNIMPVFYTLDNARRVVDPIGQVTMRLSGDVSYISASNKFIDEVRAAVNAADVPSVEFVSSSLAELLLLFDERTRDKCVMFADVGELSTAFSIGRGDGIAVSHCFSWGGARISKAISDTLGIDLTEAELLKRKVILSLEPEYAPPEGEKEAFLMTEYTVESGGEQHKYPVAPTNNAVRSEIERLARVIKKTLKDHCTFEYPQSGTLYITGGGLCLIRGATGYLSELLERDVRAVKPAFPGMDKPQFSSALGLCDIVLDNGLPSVGFFGRVKNRLFKR